MDMDSLKAIIQALRGDPSASGITRDPGQLPRRISDGNPLGSVNQDINYSRYKRQQASIGESPVSYEEWKMTNAS